MSAMRALVIGAEGFVGGHLRRHLSECGDDIVGTCLISSGEGDPLLPLDVKDRDAVRELVHDVAPDVVYHLAAISFVPETMKDPSAAFAVNTLGTVHVFEALTRLRRPSRMVFVSTGEVYGLVRPHEVPVSEEQPVDPRTPYAASKVATELALRGCAGVPGAPEWIVLRSFNHTGPGQGPSFVCSDFASQVAAIEAERQEPVIRVGNLSAERDFTDVRDVVRAYRMVAKHGSAGSIYNVASERPISIQSVLDSLLALSSAEIRVETDPDRMRPIDMPVMAGDASALRRATGWQPEIPFDDTLRDLLEFWRSVEGGAGA
ncbi:MAG: GDP-mannose 4,6-dehydratase [Gemmatimonadetes bacterium]|nr:GDP-mannose 4,6-dehydratase [Gemmatimonadota bacterium]